MPAIEIAPSILSADVHHLREDALTTVPYADVLHIDIMDGKFVPNTTFSPNAIASLNLDILYDVHLMVQKPAQKWIPAFAKIPQVRTIIFHIEAVKDAQQCMSQIRSLGKQPGISLKPKTPLKAIEPYLEDLSQVLVMTVEPGKGGQAFMPEMLLKVRAVRDGHPGLDISIDGGINDETIKDAANAGANIFVTGSYLFSQKDRKKTILHLRKIAERHYRD